jgi:large subunit ribosomal protein L21e
MVKRIGTLKRKTRQKLKKKLKRKGKINLYHYVQNLAVGDSVLLSAESSIQKGMYAPRFHGKIGIIKGKRGNCYNVLIRDAKKEKNIIVHPIHLKKV